MLCNMSAAPAKSIDSLTESDLRLMRIFRVVAESGGLTAAEICLNMERSTISRHLKRWSFGSAAVYACAARPALS